MRSSPITIAAGESPSEPAAGLGDREGVWARAGVASNVAKTRTRTTNGPERRRIDTSVGVHPSPERRGRASAERLREIGDEVVGVFDADGWEADLGRSPGPSYPVDLPSNGPPYPRAGASDVIGWEMSGHGADFFHDITDVAPYTRADMDYALQTVLNKAKTTILLSHRGTKMLFSAPLNPFLDLIHTAYVDHSRVQAQGKVQSISWKMDPDGGSAIMDVKIAISSTGAGGLDVEDPLEAPPVPADPTYTPPPPRSGETRFGQMTTSQFPQADTTEVSTGYLGNRTLDSHPDFDSGKPYVEEFRFSAPEIEDALTEPLDEEQPEVVYIVNVPEDLLILN